MVCNVYDGPFNPVMYSFFMYKGFLNAVGFHLDSCQSRFLLAHKEVDHDSHSAFNVCAHVSEWGCILRACCTHSVLSFTGSEQSLPYTAHSGAATDIGDVSYRLATPCCHVPVLQCAAGWTAGGLPPRQHRCGSSQSAEGTEGDGSSAG